MSAIEAVRIATDDLRVGCVIKHPIIDTASTLLLAGGVKISEQIKQGLKKRNIDFVFLHPDDVRSANGISQLPSGKIRTPAANPKGNVQSRVDALAVAVSSSVQNTGKAIRDRVVFPGAVSYDPEQRRRLTEGFNAAATLITKLIDDALDGGKHGAYELASVATNYVFELTQDSGHVISNANEMAQCAGVSPRMVRMSILAMAIAVELGFDENNVRTVGVSALVHDWGLFSLDEKLRDFDQPMTEDDWLQYEKHPVKSVDLLEGMAGISGVVRLVTYQVHERLDGSGYPKGRSAEAIHIFARIIAVADVYISLVSRVRGRPPLIPYDAIVCLMHQVKQGKLDGDVVRALLRAMSMFPIGSHLRLSDGSEVRVMRSNPEEYSKPIVQKLTNGDGVRIDATHEATIINLAQSSLTPATPLATPNRREMRLDQALLNEMVWDGPGS